MKPEVLKIRKGLFFPEDFSKLPEGTFIYISKGMIMNIDDNDTDNNDTDNNDTDNNEKEDTRTNIDKKTGKRGKKPTFTREVTVDLLIINYMNLPSQERKNLMKKRLPGINLNSFLSGVARLRRKYNITPNEVGLKSFPLITSKKRVIERLNERPGNEDEEKEEKDFIEFPRKKVKYSDLID